MRSFISNMFGKFANYKFPKTIQNFINKQYIKAFNIDMSEFKSYDKYDSLNALFTRHLVKPRCIENSSIIAPCDGLILDSGISSEGKAMSIKGKTYEISTLLGEDDLEDLNYANIYLSPKDYHHYHAPCDIKILKAEYFSAELFSVAPKVLRKIPNLYAKNERVVLKCELKNSKILWIVFVGALNVGKMKFDFDERIKTNAKLGDATYEYENLEYQKGDHLGNFELGSTILLLSPKDALKFSIKANDRVKFGDKFGEILP
ncbi:phosphatidylserine decarboxylase [Campylobacter corcagiensis]|uniref:phosphatidylserine decarboxylase n=1 Tax=Campylobacter corcagiensis TaxID=1448857 RepID=A0A7M1LE77_9BACT|nr:phosphatidylserine decarboxylase [Campylobacter corcagiensis]QKF64964.1 phosphatidylserine decarboxylase, proenzyme [Campylobacter corcagiensis]QOQ86879.1 phosphatidylserine decarboxylase [Campylobacter corcagiensis]